MTCKSFGETGLYLAYAASSSLAVWRLGSVVTARKASSLLIYWEIIDREIIDSDS